MTWYYVLLLAAWLFGFPYLMLGLRRRRPGFKLGPIVTGSKSSTAGSPGWPGTDRSLHGRPHRSFTESF